MNLNYNAAAEILTVANVPRKIDCLTVNARLRNIQFKKLHFFLLDKNSKVKNRRLNLKYMQYLIELVKDILPVLQN